MKIHILLIVILLTNFNDATSIDIQCNFTKIDFDRILDQYTCSVHSSLKITARNTEIHSVEGTHLLEKNENDVSGLSIRDKVMKYIPANLSEKFKNLVAIRIRNVKLKEVTQKDFISFHELRFLNLDANDLEVLDDNLFEFNPLLEVIWFEGNNIKVVGQSIFENMKNLRDIDLSRIVCISMRVKNQSEMATFVDQINLLCYDSATILQQLKQKYEELNLSNLFDDNKDPSLASKMKQFENFVVLIFNFTNEISGRNRLFQKKHERISTYAT
ncbi:hypothetical protein ACKWTF_016609 [Chironomus riparius]